ncbi:hypothetical protein GCM10009120_07840 [Sphingobacterium siyangense subsp. cladoniae]
MADLQALLDSYNVMNQRFPALAGVMSDDYYVLDRDFNAVTNEAYRNQYYWQPEPNFGNWATIYMGPIITTNVVLDNIQNVLSEGNKAALDQIYASALFYRSFYYYCAAQLYTPPYKQESAATDLGLPLRLNSDFNEVSVRSSVEETYQQIIKDLQESIPLLPDMQLLKTRPTKAAAYGTLARVYLTMGDYQNAGRFADLCINAYSPDSLMDYNTLNASATAPFTRFNKEVIFQSVSQTHTMLANSRAKIDSSLYQSYGENDLRKQLFFRNNNNGTYSFKGDYDGRGTSTSFVFGGIALDEMYLIRAETNARQNQLSQAMADLNKLLAMRFSNGSFTPLTASTQKEALGYILSERRKELIWRGLRWTDLRRLKDDPDFSVTPQRNIMGQIYSLTPNSPRYTMLIPPEVINTSGMQQNP